MSYTEVHSPFFRGRLHNIATKQASAEQTTTTDRLRYTQTCLKWTDRLLTVLLTLKYLQSSLWRVDLVVGPSGFNSRGSQARRLPAALIYCLAFSDVKTSTPPSAQFWWVEWRIRKEAEGRYRQTSLLGFSFRGWRRQNMRYATIFHKWGRHVNSAGTWRYGSSPSSLCTRNR
jgi:hypothetical protein